MIKYNVSGVIKSVDDDRDYKINKLIKTAVKLPDKYINPITPIIFNQGNVGCCVGCSSAQIKHYIESKQTNDDKAFSPMYIYANRRDDDYHGSGMMPREALKNLRDFGMCHYDEFPDFYEYDEAHQKYITNKEELDKDAYPYRISSFYRLDTTEEIKTAIYTMGYAFISYDVYECMFHPDENGIVKYDPNDKNVLGGHQLTVIGWNETGFIIVNSWGEDFGIGMNENNSKGGMFIIPYDYKPSECWAIVDEVTEKEISEKYGN